MERLALHGGKDVSNIPNRTAAGKIFPSRLAEGEDVEGVFVCSAESGAMSSFLNKVAQCFAMDEGISDVLIYSAAGKLRVFL